MPVIHNYFVFILFAYFTWSHVVKCSLDVSLERAELTYKNPKYVENGTLNVRRTSRKSPYTLNLVGTIKHTWGNNISIHLIFEEYLHNEYRPSFVEMHFKLCNMVNKEPFIGVMCKKAGLVCPISAGYHTFMNMKPTTENFPNIFPFEKGRIAGSLVRTETKETLLEFYVVASFKQKPGGK